MIKQVSLETRRKISQALTGKHLSLEVRRKISLARVGKLTGDKNPSKRPEVRQKLRLAQLGRRWYKRKCDLTPSAELSYLLGVRYGDGRLMKYEKTSSFGFGLMVKDKDFVQEFQKCTKVILKKEKVANIWRERHGYHGYTVYSKQLFEFLTQPLESHKLSIEQFPTLFIRGFFHD